MRPDLVLTDTTFLRVFPRSRSTIDSTLSRTKEKTRQLSPAGQLMRLREGVNRKRILSSECTSIKAMMAAHRIRHALKVIAVLRSEMRSDLRLPNVDHFMRDGGEQCRELPARLIGHGDDVLVFLDAVIREMRVIGTYAKLHLFGRW